MDNELGKIAAELVTIRDLIRYGVTRFQSSGIYFGHGTDNAWDESLAIVLSSLHLPVDSDDRILDARLLLEERLEILKLFRLRIEKRIPAPYLTHSAWFCGLPFYIDERVLIPRSPIAEMIKEGFQPWYQGSYPWRILDLCAGSGCIGIACAYAYDQAEIVLADISPDALAVAAINIGKHELEDVVVLCQSDLFDQVEGLFDIIVCNPPYVDSVDFLAMPAEYRHEPPDALQSGEYGLEHPLEILRRAADFLTDDGILVLEVGNSGQHLEYFFPDVGFNWVDLKQGGHGVLVLSKTELDQYQDAFSRPLADRDDGQA